MTIDIPDLRDDDFGMLQASQVLMSSLPTQSRSEAAVLTPISARNLPSNNFGPKEYLPWPTAGGAQLTFQSESSKQTQQQQREQYRYSSPRNERIKSPLNPELRRLSTLSPAPVTKQWPTDWDPATRLRLVMIHTKFRTHRSHTSPTSLLNNSTNSSPIETKIEAKWRAPIKEGMASK